jgi:hypothetical protein
MLFEKVHMTRVHFGPCGRWVVLTVVASVLIVGCGKKQAETAAPTAATPGDTGTTATAASEPAPSEPAAPAIIVNNVNTADTKAAMSAAAAALKAKQYEDATKVLIALQQQRLTEQQAQAYRNQMIQLQGAVADGVARGDASAQAAAEMLRESARHR